MVLGSSGWAPILLPKDIGAFAKILLPGAMPVIVCATLLATIGLPEKICSLSDCLIQSLLCLRKNLQVVPVR
jgi:hypothetical protein